VSPAYALPALPTPSTADGCALSPSTDSGGATLSQALLDRLRPPQNAQTLLPIDVLWLALVISGAGLDADDGKVVELLKI
jgi:hypothetical protein